MKKYNVLFNGQDAVAIVSLFKGITFVKKNDSTEILACMSLKDCNSKLAYFCEFLDLKRDIKKGIVSTTGLTVSQSELQNICPFNE